MPITRARNFNAPAYSWVAVTPDDDADLPDVRPRALWIGTAGDVRLVDTDGNDEVFKNAPEGWLDVQPVRVMATGTTAEDILAAY